MSIIKDLSFKNYYKPTPKRIQKLADVIQGCCVTALTYSAFSDIKWLAIATTVALISSKALSELFTDIEDEVKNSTPIKNKKNNSKYVKKNIDISGMGDEK